MTAGGDFIPVDSNGYDEGPNYPKVFGITFTPTISGLLLTLVGFGGAIWLFLNLVQPALDQNQALNQEITQKQSQLLDQETVQKQIADAKARLQESKQLRSDVLSLFASEQSLDTLLLDVNERVQSVNAGIQDPDRRAVLSKFDFDAASSGAVEDGSLGDAANGRIDQRVYNVEILGSFPQTQSIIRNIERLQPLLVVEDLNSVSEGTPEIVLNNQGQVVSGQSESRLKTGFRLLALIPKEAPPAPPPPPAEGAPPEGVPPAQ